MGNIASVHRDAMQPYLSKMVLAIAKRVKVFLKKKINKRKKRRRRRDDEREGE